MNYTPFYSSHLASDGKIIDYMGWALPSYYISSIDEHNAVRNNCGMFDLSHMVITDIHGVGARDYLRYLLSNDVIKLESFGFGKAFYSVMLNQEGFIIDDLIVYYMPFGYRIVGNAINETKSLNWLRQVATNFKVELFFRRDFAMLAVQGPDAINKFCAAFPDFSSFVTDLPRFCAIEYNGYFFSKTGYTGENGLDIMLPKEQANLFWNTLLDHGVVPCGLTSRDTLRLESGFGLYGHELSESIYPISCGLDRFVDFSDIKRDFIGKNSYMLAKTSPDILVQVGLIIDGKIQDELVSEYLVQQDGGDIGLVTSICFSPTLNSVIGIAKVKQSLSNDLVYVIINDNQISAKIVTLPFVK